MNRSRSSAILVAFALFLQLGLAGEGVTCLAPSGTQASSQAGDVMAGMSDMNGAGSTATPPGEANPSAPRQQGAGNVPCERSQASTNCQLFASCAAGFVAVDARPDDEAPVAPSTVRVSELLRPSSRTIAPELPPPRA